MYDKTKSSVESILSAFTIATGDHKAELKLHVWPNGNLLGGLLSLDTLKGLMLPPRRRSYDGVTEANLLLAHQLRFPSKSKVTKNTKLPSRIAGDASQ